MSTVRQQLIVRARGARRSRIVRARDAVLHMHPQVRRRYIASIYAHRKGLIGKDLTDYLNKQESRAMGRARSSKKS